MQKSLVDGEIKVLDTFNVIIPILWGFFFRFGDNYRSCILAVSEGGNRSIPVRCLTKEINSLYSFSEGIIINQPQLTIAKL